MPTVPLTAQGHPFRVQWTDVAKATAAEVSSASVQIAPVLVSEPMNELSFSAAGSEWEFTVAQGRRIRSLTLKGLKWVKSSSEEPALRSRADLESRGLRLVVSIRDPAGNWTPVHAVPEIPKRKMLPASLTGATFSNEVLTLPDLPASKVRLAVVTGGRPDEFDVQTTKLDHVTGVAAVPPKGLELVDPAGTPVWAFPGELPPGAPAATVDLRFALEDALGKRLADDLAPDVTFRLRGAAGQANVSFAAAHGTLARSWPTVLRTELTGDPEPLGLGEPPLASETPASAVADVTVRYLGVRLLDRVADPEPSPPPAIEGRVVGDAPVVRALPPASLLGFAVARVGVVGRSPDGCELSVQLVAMDTGAVGAPLGPPGVVPLDASAEVVTVWAPLPESGEIERSVGVSVRAGKGRFLWAAAPEPLVRIAVYDAAPGGRPLRLAGTPILAVEDNETHLPAHSLPAGAFRSAAPVLSSELFLSVDLSDLTLRYAR